jgi:N-hydroxyarylamine O-acetyltransferase
VSLVPEDIVHKIVGRGRGGYCYEVNGLFALALEALGVPWRFAGARPMTYAARRPKTHVVIVATLDGEEWLIDLGFGSYGIRAPLRLADTGIEVRQDHDTFRLTRPEEHEYVLEARVEGKWAAQFSFDLWPAEWIDFMPANYVNSTHPDALFVKTLVVVLFDAEGRSMLVGDTLKLVTRGETTKRHVLPAERDIILADWFGLEPDPST